MTRRTTPARRVTGRTARPAAPVQTGLWGDDAPGPTTAAPVEPPTATNDPEQWARVLSAAVSDAGLMVATGRHPARRVMARVPGSAADGGPEHVNAVPAADAAVVLQALAVGHVQLGSGAHQVRHGRFEGPAVRVLVPARTRSMLARWAALHPLGEE